MSYYTWEYIISCLGMWFRFEVISSSVWRNYSSLHHCRLESLMSVYFLFSFLNILMIPRWQNLIWGLENIVTSIEKQTFMKGNMHILFLFFKMWHDIFFFLNGLPLFYDKTTNLEDLKLQTYKAYITICYLFFFFFSFTIFFLICGRFCHTLKWNSQGFTCVPHPNPLSHLPLHPFPLGFPSAPGLSTCLMHPTWAGDLFHPR